MSLPLFRSAAYIPVIEFKQAPAPPPGSRNRKEERS